jgi:hypothetical protein
MQNTGLANCRESAKLQIGLPRAFVPGSEEKIITVRPHQYDAVILRRNLWFDCSMQNNGAANSMESAKRRINLPSAVVSGSPRLFPPSTPWDGEEYPRLASVQAGGNNKHDGKHTK